MERGTEASPGSSTAGEHGRKRSPGTPQPKPTSGPFEAQRRQEQAIKRPKPLSSLSVTADADRADAESNQSSKRSGAGGRYKPGQRNRTKFKEKTLPTAQQENIMMLQCELEQARWATWEARRFIAPTLAELREKDNGALAMLRSLCQYFQLLAQQYRRKWQNACLLLKRE